MPVLALVSANFLPHLTKSRCSLSILAKIRSPELPVPVGNRTTTLVCPDLTSAKSVHPSSLKSPRVSARVV
jgi:hypothetical protein